MFTETELKGQLRKVYFKIKDTIHTLGWRRGQSLGVFSVLSIALNA